LRSSLGVRGGDSEESSGTEGGSAGRVGGHEVYISRKKKAEWKPRLHGFHSAFADACCARRLVS
jgi:hypothetical protein